MISRGSTRSTTDWVEVHEIEEEIRLEILHKGAGAVQALPQVECLQCMHSFSGRGTTYLGFGAQLPLNEDPISQLKLAAGDPF